MDLRSQSNWLLTLCFLLEYSEKNILFSIFLNVSIEEHVQYVVMHQSM